MNDLHDHKLERAIGAGKLVAARATQSLQRWYHAGVGVVTLTLRKSAWAMLCSVSLETALEKSENKTDKDAGVLPREFKL